MQFTDVTQAAGSTSSTRTPPTSNKYLIETMGGGVALLDYDNDGRLDVFFTNGAKLDDPMPAGKRPDKSDRQFWNRLYHQNAGRHVHRRHGEGGPHRDAADRYGMGVAVGDYDNDGFADLYVTGYGGNTLYHNNGDGTFTRRHRAGGRRGRRMEHERRVLRLRQRRQARPVRRRATWTGASRRTATAASSKPGYRAYCHPDNYRGRRPTSCTTTTATARSRDVSAKAGIADAGGQGRWASRSPTTTATASRTSSSPTTPCRASCTTTTATARSPRSACSPASASTRTARPSPAWASTSPTTTTTAGPTSSSPTFPNERYRLFRKDGDGSFQDVTNASGRGRARRCRSRAGARGFVDYDNDGWKDLFVAQGHVMDTIEKTSPNLKYLQPPLLLRNESGPLRASRCRRRSSRRQWAGRGAAFGDLDNDGDVDVVVSNVGQQALVLRNDGGNREQLARDPDAWARARTATASACRVKVVSASGPTQYFTVTTAAAISRPATSG